MKTEALDALARRLLADHGVVAPRGEELLADLLGAAWPRRVRAGDVLCREGDPGTELLVLLEGKVRVSKRDYLGVDQLVAVVPAPAMLGQMSMIDGSPRSATCLAEEDGAVVAFDEPRFRVLMRDPDARGDLFRRLLISSMSRQLRRGNAELRDLVARPALDDATAAGALSRAEATFSGWR